MSKEIACFGLYLGGPVCDQCVANRRCKALLVSNGFDLVNSLTEQLSQTLPDFNYRDTDKVSEIVDLLLHPVFELDRMPVETEEGAFEAGLLNPLALTAEETKILHNAMKKPHVKGSAKVKTVVQVAVESGALSVDDL